MPAYKNKVTVVNVEAVRLTSELAALPGTWPQYLTDAWNRLPNEVNAIFRATNGNPEADTEMFLVLNSVKGTDRVVWGDYLVEADDGSLLSIGATDFSLLYEPVV